jgi:hypothetical protein
MARQKNGSILGEMSGKVGNVVLTRWKDIKIVKSCPTPVRKGKESVKQLKQRALFRSVMEFLSCLGKRAVNLGFQLPKNAKITASNAAASYHLQHAVSGKYPEYYIDLEKVRLSKPLNRTEEGLNAKFSSKGKGMSVQWELNSFPEKTTRLDDRAIVVAFNGTRGIGLSYNEDNILRSSLSYSFACPDRFVGDEIFCWMFFVSANGKRVSETQYLGSVTLRA